MLLVRAFEHIRPAATMIRAGLSDPRMKIEIEVTARRPAGCGTAAAIGLPLVLGEAVRLRDSNGPITFIPAHF